MGANTLIAFRVPRMHEVTPVMRKDAYRTSVYGWFLKREDGQAESSSESSDGDSSDNGGDGDGDVLGLSLVQRRGRGCSSIDINACRATRRGSSVGPVRALDVSEVAQTTSGCEPGE